MRTDVWVRRFLGIAAVGCVSGVTLMAQSLDTLLNEGNPAAAEQVIGEEVLAEELPVSEDVQPPTNEQPSTARETPMVETPPPADSQGVGTPPLGQETAVQESVPLVEEQATVETPPVPVPPAAVAEPTQPPVPATPAPKRGIPAQRHKGHFLLGDEQIAGEILSSKEDKRLLIDGDIIYARLKQGEQAEVGQVIWIYHVGPSIYDTTLRNVSINQATLIGKLRVLEVKGSVLSGQIVRAYSPILVGDVLVK